MLIPSYRSAAADASPTGRAGDVVNAIVTGVAVVPGAMFAVVIAGHYPANHVGLDLRPTAILPAAAAVWLGVAIARQWGSPWLTRTLAVLAVLVVVEFLVGDHWNLMDDYDLWIDRGMPSPWQFAW